MTPRQEGGWYLTRMTLVCCAADARATKIVVRGVAAPPADAWVSVTGRHAPSADADPEKALAVLTADSVTPVPAPAETYE